ncbi:MAG: hypothetical protein A3B38_00955 [Candidatus Levybacteria bacterium RIFCSPLOWO2_01_FULL_36_13]|nr:MAG: hypothetical protein A2684_02195 [Candidatus Levybacteria bacterium RIFCSPHIGHO2_01_FULL_36_15b]OGH35457.1 MAG: hypothetical protein A3B38_00955 [Candidatus Levybacteria bacterium RIFCSPLOWO2_01_FULL_36_13]
MKLFLGISLTLISFIHWYLQLNAFTLLIAHAIFVVGNILILDFISLKLNNYSLIAYFFDRKNFIGAFAKLSIAGVIFAFFLEFYLHYMGKFWYFPYWNYWWYFLLLIPGWAGYVFYFVEIYLGTRAVLSRFVKPSSKINISQFMKFMLYLCSITAVLSTLWLLMNINFLTLKEFLSINFTKPIDVALILPLFLASISLSFIFDYLVYKRKNISFFFSFFQGRPISLISILLGGWIVGFVWEIFNQKALFWHYSNVPFSELTFLEIPVMVIIFWPIQFFPILSLYYLFFDAKEA